MDVDKLPLQDLDILGFGEALHGPDDFLNMRNDLFKHLVKNHGFTTLAIESSFTHSRLVNEYVNHNGAAAWTTGLSHGLGQVQANREIIDWMREANKTREAKLQFHGFDIPGLTANPCSPRQTLQHFTDIEPFEALLGPETRWEDTLKWREKKPDISGLKELMAGLEGHYAHLARKQVDFFEALARDAGWSESLQIRDDIMADNLAYILQQSPGKVLAFAHNVHLQKGPASISLGDWRPAGMHLQARHRYAVIGTGVQQGEGIEEAEEGTYEALYPGWHKAANRNLKQRSASPTNLTYQPLNPQTLTDFDWIEVLACVS